MRTLILLLLFIVTAYGQQAKPKLVEPQPCSLTVDTSPTVRGLKLGQSTDDLTKVFSVYANQQAKATRSLLPNDDDIGLLERTLWPYRLPRPEQLEDIHRVELAYLDAKLSHIKIVYETGTHWQSNLHFTSAIAEQLKLPKTGWQGEDPSTLRCDGFFVKIANANLLPTLQITIQTLNDEIDRRIAAAEEKKRAKFKP